MLDTGFDVFNVQLHGCNMELHDASMTCGPDSCAIATAFLF
jgi:hypothetical protein